MNVTDPCTPKTGIRQAIEDGLVTAGAALLSALIAVGGVPSLNVAYGIALPTGLIFVSTYALKRGITNDSQTKTQ